MTHQTFKYIKENPLLPYIHKHMLYDYIRKDTHNYCIAFIYGGD